MKKLKDDVFRAQRMYYLSLKLEGRIPGPLVIFSKGILNEYTRIAKEMDLKLSPEDLYDRIFNR
jgi:hypothetical protein